MHRTRVPRDSLRVPERDAWHLFEVHLAVRGDRQGKRYKDWLFDRAGGLEAVGVEAVAGGAAVLMRDVVREHLRRECHPAGVLSLHAPLGTGMETGLTLEDLLPGGVDPAEAAALREFEELASAHANSLMSDMGRRERVALLAKDVGLSLAHPAVEKVAGCRKSALNSTYQEMITRVARRVRMEHPDDDVEAVRVLTVMTLSELRRRTRLWGEADRDGAALLAVAEAG